MNSTDLIIIGAGPGGYQTAARAAAAGLQTVIIEAESLGGTCLNVGCIPTKCFCRNAELLRSLKESEAFGLTNLSYGFNMAKVVERKDEVVGQLVTGIASLLRHPGITLVRGRAQMTGPHTVRVPGATDAEGNAISEEYTAPHIIIAAGSVTKFLPIEGAHSPRVLTSTEMLNLTEVPRRLCVIGGGVIGMEFASIFHAFGSEVTVVEFCKEILPTIDSDIAKRLRTTLKAQGLNIITGAAVNKIEDKADGATVGYELKGKQESVEADIVLMAVGRAARTEGLGLEEAGIACDRRGIQTDDDFQTTVPGVYAVGDVNGKCQLAHAAEFQSRYVLLRILAEREGDGQTYAAEAEKMKRHLNVVPAAVFTQPEVASIGLTSEACKAAGIKATAHKGFFRANGKALAMGEGDGMVKILSDDSGRILGCHILGAHAADLVHELLAAINTGATVSDIATWVHAHPTLSEVILSAAEA